MDIQREERKIIVQAKKDPEAFGRLYDKYYPQIYGFILKRTGNVEVAQDLVSETFFAAVKNIWRYKITNRPFKAWLYKIAVAQIGQYYRNKKTVCEITLDESPELIASKEYNSDSQAIENEEITEVKLLQKEVHELLLKLPDVQHTIIILRYFENRKVKDIARILDLKENTVKSHLRRSLKKLHNFINKQEKFKQYGWREILQYRRESV